MPKPMPDQELLWWASWRPGCERVRRLTRLVGVCVCLSVVLLSGWEAAHAASSESGVEEWPAYGRDPGGSRYSPLTQITRDNVTQLQVAWTYRTGEAERKALSAWRASFEATPLVIDGTLYLSTPFNRVIALDPATGAERWTYDPHVDVFIPYAVVTSRGVSTWLDPDRPAGTPCRRRIFVGTIDARLIALDAATGVPCHDFGQDGQVDLTRDVRLVQRGMYQVTSPPAVSGDLVVVGSTIGDNRAMELERGVVRAFEARTGQRRWSWDPIPQDPADPARSTWEGSSATRTGAANAWSVLSVDPERDLVFVPTSSPSPDFYGGGRRGSNLYANAVVALRASTGTVVWSFQVVHHDLWDYDVPAQPTLLTVPRDGQDIEPLLGPSGAPCNPPPWGTLAAVDLATAAVRWQVPLGIEPEAADVPEAAAWGSLNAGGSLVTAGGLVFIAAAKDTSLRAFDVETGQELWKGPLPASAQATPMTYRLSETGKQFVVIAAGGHGLLGTKKGDYVVAFTLP